ncbi:hypothetical protein DICVIV_08214 [Dictyocaulus viviparus]|uniref:Uncharacterized protein n=1 Tax=Dictyocaulus viviparus TaxID=29172 RepID=A0A0D8XPN1_DICVI|nr:hypothetical protein DICVIV_08214 [Dictyocaulus viviparus]
MLSCILNYGSPVSRPRQMVVLTKTDRNRTCVIRTAPHNDVGVKFWAGSNVRISAGRQESKSILELFTFSVLTYKPLSKKLPGRRNY